MGTVGAVLVALTLAGREAFAQAKQRKQEAKLLAYLLLPQIERTRDALRLYVNLLNDDWRRDNAIHGNAMADKIRAAKSDFKLPVVSAQHDKLHVLPDGVGYRLVSLHAPLHRAMYETDQILGHSDWALLRKNQGIAEDMAAELDACHRRLSRVL